MITFYIFTIAALILLGMAIKSEIEEGDYGFLIIAIVTIILLSLLLLLLARGIAIKNVRTNSLPQIETVIETKIVDNKAVSDTTYIYHFQN